MHIVEDDGDLVHPESEEDDDDDVLSVVDPGLSTSGLANDAAESLGVNRKEQTSSRPATKEGTGKEPASGKRTGTKSSGQPASKRQATGRELYIVYNAILQQKGEYLRVITQE